MAVDPKKLAAFAKGGSSKKGGFGKQKKKPDEDEREVDEYEEEDEDEDGEEEEEEEEHGDDGGDGGEEEHGDVDVESVAQEIADGKGDKRLMKLAKKMLGEDGQPKQNPPQWVGKDDEPTWERAKEAVDPEGEGSKYDEPWAVVVAVYEKMGGKIR